MSNPGAIGFVLVNFDGIPVQKHASISETQAVQYAALVSDLVLKTKSTLRLLGDAKAPAEKFEFGEFEYLRLRTKADTELIVTDFQTPGTGYQYILVCIQDCGGPKVDSEEEGDDA